MSLTIPVKELFLHRDGATSKHASWKEIELGVAVKIQNGYPFESKYFNPNKEGIPLIRIRDILTNKSDTYYSNSYDNGFLVQAGDFLIGMDGDFNCTLWSGKQGLLNQRVCRLIVNETILLKKFIFYGIGGYLKKINENTSSVTVKHLSSNSIKEIPFSLPPLPEQRRIVAKLDTLFGHLDQLRTRLEKIPERLKQFREAVLSQAVTGKLTNAKYEVKPLDEFDLEVETGPFGSALHKEDYIVGGTPVINPSHIYDGKICSDEGVSINQKKLRELTRWLLRDGDVILGRRGEMGRAAKYESNVGPAICGTGSLILRKNNLIEPEFLSFYLRSPFSIQFLEMNAVGSTMVNLNQKIIKSLPFPAIGLQEQKEIIKKVKDLSTISDRIESNYKTLQEKIEQLPHAILSKAFRGELVAQETEKELRKYNEQLGKMEMAAKH